MFTINNLDNNIRCKNYILHIYVYVLNFQAKNMRMTVEMKSFHLDCEYFAKIGEQLSKIIFGNDDSLYLDWKDKQINFDSWMKKIIISNQFSVKR